MPTHPVRQKAKSNCPKEDSEKDVFGSEFFIDNKFTIIITAFFLTVMPDKFGYEIIKTYKHITVNALHPSN